MAEHYLVHILRPDAGMLQGLGRDADDQALDRLGVELAEGCVSPADDTGCHGCLLKDYGVEPKVALFGAFSKSDDGNVERLRNRALSLGPVLSFIDERRES
jgi:hypothetical protein